ncbi:MAG: fumarylacetoacetate hydrolase family protein [Burkholderiaceae bacterium]|nr:fumarylacetoacetate hydrolase family protein [Burkholderiaceae bacterium]
MADLPLDPSSCLPDDGAAGTLIGRCWLPGEHAGPAVVAVRPEGVFDLSQRFATVSDLLDDPAPAAAVRATHGRRVGTLAEILRHTLRAQRDAPTLLAPIDLQVIKAAGVTFASSLLERVIEEQAKGDPSRAEAVRAEVQAAIGTNLASVKPGSPAAAALKAALQSRGLWSQYLEVGIGPDAEVFTKAPLLSALGSGVPIGVRGDSAWNNPEPEVVLAVNSRAHIVGATLGNDVNLRDFEGRSALLLGKSKDNNGSTAIGPFIRLFDSTFSLDDVRKADLTLTVTGTDGFVLEGSSTMREISRDPLDLVAQTTAMHQYPDGFVLFCGTLFAPTQDRGAPGSGFTHHVGDIVRIRSAKLGELVNRIELSERLAPWTYGVRALMGHVHRRQAPAI